MKRNLLLVSLSAAFALASASAFAQTCASPVQWQPPAGGDSKTGTLCGGTDSVALYCGGLDSAGKNDAIYQSTFAANGSRTFNNITLTGTGFTPVMYVYSGGCATGDGCLGSGDASTPIPNDASIGAGTFFIAVTAAASDAAGACGQYTIAADGTFPVTVQSFSVE